MLTMEPWEELIMTYQNYLNYHALKEFGESRRAELLKVAEDERLRPESNHSRSISSQVNFLLQSAQAFAALILSIIQR